MEIFEQAQSEKFLLYSSTVEEINILLNKLENECKSLLQETQINLDKIEKIDLE